MTKVFRTLMVACLLLTAVMGIAQQQTNGCGGTTCVQPHVDTGLPLDARTAVLYQAQNGAKLIIGFNEEDLTLSTGGTTTDTANAAMLPANSFIFNITGTLTTAISGGTCSGWQLGDPTTAGRFTASNTTLTQGTTDIGKVHVTTGVASATTGFWQASAAKVRVTCATGAPGAGKVRLTVTYFQWIPPQI